MRDEKRNEQRLAKTEVSKVTQVLFTLTYISKLSLKGKTLSTLGTLE